jgi:hypothetical protein
MVRERTGSSRRQFLVVGLGLGGGVMLGWLRPWRALVQIDAPSLAVRLSGLLAHEQSARAVGLAYLRAAPPNPTVDGLVDLLADGLPGRRRTLRSASDGELRRLLALRSQQDFAEERVIALDGWIASVTEARLCGIAALVSSR